MTTLERGIPAAGGLQDLIFGSFRSPSRDAACCVSTGGLSSRQLDATGNVVLDPVRIPPFPGIDLHTFELHAEVDVVASGHTRHTALAHHLPALHRVAFVNVDLAQMAIDRLQAVAVVDDDAVAVDSERRPKPRVRHSMPPPRRAACSTSRSQDASADQSSYPCECNCGRRRSWLRPLCLAVAERVATRETQALFLSLDSPAFRCLPCASRC